MYQTSEPELDVVALYRAYADPLLRFVRRIAANRGLSESLVDTEGVVQEAFLTLLGSSRTIHNPPAWLFTVARRLVGKIAAAHQGQRAGGDPQNLLQAETVQWTSLASRTSTEDIAEARRVLEDIAGLSDYQKIAVYLRHVEGWTTAEISEYLACAPATTSVHIHRGTRRLRNRFRAPKVRKMAGGTRYRHHRRWTRMLPLGWALWWGLVAVLSALIVKWPKLSSNCPEPEPCPLPGLDARVPDLEMLAAVFGVGVLVGLVLWFAIKTRPPQSRARTPSEPSSPDSIPNFGQ